MMIGITTRETFHGNPGERRILPADLPVILVRATNLPAESPTKYWATPLPGRVGLWPADTRDWAETVGVGLHADDVLIP